MPGKRIQFDADTLTELENLADDRMMTFQELFDEALRDLLRKYGRPTSLKEAFRKSADKSAQVISIKRANAKKKPAPRQSRK
jgi:hypothetical protein